MRSWRCSKEPRGGSIRRSTGNLSLATLVALAAIAFTAACADLGLDFGSGSDSLAPGQESASAGGNGWGHVNTGPLPAGCTKLEGNEIGQDGVQASFSGTTVTIDSWRTKDGESGEYIGFTYTATQQVWLSVKCGGDIFQQNGDGSWVNPNGTAGPEAHAISNVVCCPPADGEGGDGAGGGGSGGSDGDPTVCTEENLADCL